MPLTILVITSLLSVLILVVGLGQLRRILNLLNRGRRVPGTIVDIIQIKNHHGVSGYLPLVRYRTLDGRELTGKPSRWALVSFQSVPSGPVTVIYDETRPSRILVEHAGAPLNWVTPVSAFVAYLVVAGAVAASGVIAYTGLA